MTDAFWSFDVSWPRLAAGLLLAAALAALTVRRWRREPGRRRAKLLLEVPRWLAVAALLVTLLKPEHVRLVGRREAPVVAVLLDGSGSMATRDVPADPGTPALSRAEWLEARRAAPFWAPLEETGRVRVETFAAPPPEGEPGADDPATDLAAALADVAARPETIRAVLLASDGDWNRGESPVGPATRLRARGVPVFAVTAGREQPLPDLELVSVTAPAYGLVDDHLSIPFTVRSRMPREVRTVVRLEGPDGSEWARRAIAVPPLSRADGALAFVPRAEGRVRLRVRVPVEAGESDPANNDRAFDLALRREVLRVLLVESEPRWEYRYLRNALVRDPGVDVRCVLWHPALGAGEGPHYLAAFPGTREALSAFDVFILGDVGHGAGLLTEEDASLLRGVVEQQGSGLIVMPGASGRALSLWDGPLGPILPVAMDAGRAASEGQSIVSRLVLTTRGRDHLLTLLAVNADENEAVWRGLPGFQWSAPVLRARPGADVLAVHGDARNDFGRLPLLVAQPAGNGKVLFMGTDSAWRWRRGVEDVYHYRFWGQVIRWMAHRRHLAGAQGLRFFYAPEQPAVGDRLYLHAAAFDDDGRPLEGGSVELRIRRPGGAEERIDLAPEPGGWGTFAGTCIVREGGDHEFDVFCPDTGRRVTATVAVRRPVTERVGEPARGDVLREIASITGGRAASHDGLDALVRDIRLLPEPKPLEVRRRLWAHPLWAGAIVFLLAANWVARKMTGRI